MIQLFFGTLIVIAMGIATIAVCISKRKKIGDTAFVCVLFLGGLLTVCAIVFLLCVGFFVK